MSWFWDTTQKQEKENGSDTMSHSGSKNGEQKPSSSIPVIFKTINDKATTSNGHRTDGPFFVRDDIVIDKDSHIDSVAEQTSQTLSSKSELYGSSEDDDDGCDEDDVSMIDDSSSVDLLDEDLLETSSEEDEEKEERTSNKSKLEQNDGKHNPGIFGCVDIESATATRDDNNVADDDVDDSHDDSDEQGPTSFWEKQSLLILAAEHDRVDILRGILSDDEDDKERLMNGGIPPLHLSIAFGSVSVTVALLRMGADPSIRPNIDGILEEQKEQPDDSKVEIPNIRRFDGLTAWELAFGNKSYENAALDNTSKSWSLFGPPPASSLTSSNKTEPTKALSFDSTHIIKPIDMPPSKREGVRHAFTAEALRSIGGDEVHRLCQLLDSGMPATVDIGGKDMYGWAVEMGALHCEERLRPLEAEKYSDVDIEDSDSVEEYQSSFEASALSTQKRSSFVVHRPTEETTPQLKNRLDELDSLSSALSTCLDNLAEEVSVCHGLLLMGGGATALASHVKSLKLLKIRKLSQLDQTQRECEELQCEFHDLVASTGDVGREIANTSTFILLDGKVSTIPTDATTDKQDLDGKATDSHRMTLLAQIAAIENKIRKLRSSISDLSEENSRDMKEVQRRGLEGGINLVRGLREEIRDLDFQLGELRSVKADLRTRTAMIHARIPAEQNCVQKSQSKTECLEDKPSDVDSMQFTSNTDERIESPAGNFCEDADALWVDQSGNSHDVSRTQNGNSSKHELESSSHNVQDDDQAAATGMTPSEQIASGKSTAIAVIPPGNRGFFTLDLWQVLLRIMGLERAAYRRSVQVANTHPKVMIV